MWHFFSLFSFNVRKIFVGFTILVVISTSIVFSLVVSRPTYGWSTNISTTSWLWNPHNTLTIRHSPFFSGLPLNLKGQSHFLVPVVIYVSLLYCLYFLPLSQPKTTNVFLPYCSFEKFDLKMTITKLKSNATAWAHFNNSSQVWKTYINNIQHILVKVHLLSIKYINN